MSAALKILQQALKVSACVSHRLAPDTDTDIPERWNTIIVPQPDNALEIVAFVEAKLELCLTNRKLVLGDPALILEIQDSLLNASRGMFLWVALQIHSLYSMMTTSSFSRASTHDNRRRGLKGIK